MVQFFSEVKSIINEGNFRKPSHQCKFLSLATENASRKDCIQNVYYQMFYDIKNSIHLIIIITQISGVIIN